MKKRFNLTWRIVTTILLLLALMPALVGGVAVAATYGDVTSPTLLSISWVDDGFVPGHSILGDGIINAGDHLKFYFSESMDTSTLNEMNVINIRLDSTAGGTGAGNDYGSSSAVPVWTADFTTLVITLGTDRRDDLPGATVNPTGDVKDRTGNADNTTATVRIPIAPDSADTGSPYLLSVSWEDAGIQDGIINANDILVLHFSESISTVGILPANVDTFLGINGTPPHITGSGAIAWLAGNTMLQVQLGAGETIEGGESLTPTFKDWHNNAFVSPTPKATIPLPPNPAPPVLVDVVWWDNGAIANVLEAGEVLYFRFSETVDAVGLVPGVLPLWLTASAPTVWGGAGLTVGVADGAGSMWAVTLGAGASLPTGTCSFTPTALVHDKADLLRQCTGSATISATSEKTTSLLSANAKEIIRPYLRSINWWDNNFNGVYDNTDDLYFYWSESMSTGIINTRVLVNSLMDSTAVPGSTGDYGTTPSFVGDFVWTGLSDTMLRVTLLPNEIISGGETVPVAATVLDPRGLADATGEIGNPAVTIPLAPDTTKPTLKGIGWNDVGNAPGVSVPNDGIINQGDEIVFRFSEAMDIASFTGAYDFDLPITGTDAVEIWNSAAVLWAFGDGATLGSQMTLQLGAGETISGGETVNPAGYITDAKGIGAGIGNADDTSSAGVAIPLPPDKIRPYLTGILWTDVNGNSMRDFQDELVFYFSESMNPLTIIGTALGPTFVGTALESNAAGTGLDYGALGSVQVIWNTPVNTQCRVILGIGETIVGGEGVDPTDVVTDPIGNIDATPAAVTIPFAAGTPATLTVVPTTLTFNYYINGTAPASQTVSISNSGTQTLSWSASSPTKSWLNVTPTIGSIVGIGANTLTFAVNVSGLNISANTDTITVTGAGTSQAVAVTLNILAEVIATPTPTATPATNASTTPTATATATPTSTPVVTATATPTSTPSPSSSTGSGSIGTGAGSVETADGKVEVSFPAGSFDSATTVTITTGISCHEDTDAYIVGSTCFRITPDGALGAEATICVELSSYDLGLGDEEDLTLGYWDGDNWILASDITVTGNTICGKTSHLSDWAVLSKTGEGWLWWYWALIGGGAFIVVLAIILLLVLPKRGKGEEIPSEELYGEEEEEF